MLCWWLQNIIPNHQARHRRVGAVAAEAVTFRALIHLQPQQRAPQLQEASGNQPGDCKRVLYPVRANEQGNKGRNDYTYYGTVDRDEKGSAKLHTAEDFSITSTSDNIRIPWTIIYHICPRMLRYYTSGPYE